MRKTFMHTLKKQRYSKTGLKPPLKRPKNNFPNYRLMQVDSVAECSKSSFFHKSFGLAYSVY